MRGMRSFVVGDHHLVVAPRGLTGQWALACALGINRLPATIEAALARAEWVDIVAKARGMVTMNPDLLFRFPVARQHCGCRVAFVPIENATPVVARFVVHLCSGHPWAPPEGVSAAELAEVRLSDDTLVLGHLIDRRRIAQ